MVLVNATRLGDRTIAVVGTLQSYRPARGHTVETCAGLLDTIHTIQQPSGINHLCNHHVSIGAP